MKNIGRLNEGTVPFILSPLHGKTFSLKIEKPSDENLRKKIQPDLSKKGEGIKVSYIDEQTLWFD